MKKRIQLYLIIAVSVVAFDIGASIASKSIGFDYTKLIWISRALHFSAGYVGSRYFDFITGVLGGLVAGLADSTLGWGASSAIGPHISFYQPQYTPLLILTVIIVVSVQATVIGLIGAILGKIMRRSRGFADAQQALGADSP